MTDYIENIKANNVTYPIGGDNFNGQWSTEFLNILLDVTLSGNTRYTYSLENYLPDDDYDYEVMFWGCSSSTASSGKTCQLTLYTGVASEQEQGWRLNRCTARTNATVRAGGCAIIPIYKSNRNIITYTQDSTTNNTGTYLIATGYRRIGDNSGTVSNLNSYPIGGKNFDGKPVMFDTDQSGLSVGSYNSNEHNILFHTTIGAESHATFSVAQVIPNDGYDYELCFSVYTTTPSTSGKVTNLLVAQGTHTTRPPYNVLVGYRIARTGAGYTDFKTLWLPISASDKNITFFNVTSSTTTTYNCMIHGYRRIGTND